MTCRCRGWLTRFITRVEYYLDCILKKNKTDDFLIHKFGEQGAKSGKFLGNFNPFGKPGADAKAKVD